MSEQIYTVEENPTPTTPKKKKKVDVMFLCIGIVFLIHGISLLVPFYWMVATALKGKIELRGNYLGLPKEWRWDNIKEVFNIMKLKSETSFFGEGALREYDILAMLGNSVAFAIVGSFFGLLPLVLCSYVAAKYKFVGSKALFAINLFVMIVPITGSLANTLTIYRQMGIYKNPLLFMILPGVPFGFNWLLLYGQFKGIPASYSEAVYLDGGGHFTVFFKIILPIVSPILTALFVLSFLGRWNDYMSMVLYVPGFPTISYGLYKKSEALVRNNADGQNIVMAAYLICSIPSVALFCSFQKVINKSLTVGGLKE